jgi:predicted Zn finger-like uncharacterized protein
MEIKCPACQAGFRIPNEKLPKDREEISFSCPKCAHPITVNIRKEIDDLPRQPDAEEIQVENNGAVEMESNIDKTYDATEKPFDFVEEGQQTALICESDPDMAEKIDQSLKNLDFSCAQAKSTLVAIKYMRYHVFDLVVLNENFDGKDPTTNPIRLFISRLPMATRRNMFVTLLTSQFQTMDNMAAFQLSVNQVIHKKNIDEIVQIIRRGLDDNNAFYSTFKRVSEVLNAADAV